MTAKFTLVFSITKIKRVIVHKSSQHLTSTSMKNTPQRFSCIPVLFLYVLLSCSPSQATEISKANNTSALNTTNSWVGGVVPTTNDIAAWNSTLTAGRSATIGTNLSFAGLKVSDVPAGTTNTIAATTGASLTLGASGIDMSNAAGDLSISAALNFAADQTWSVAAGRRLMLSSLLNTGAASINAQGPGTIQFWGYNTFGTGQLTLGGGITLMTSLGGNGSSAALTISNVVNLSGDSAVRMVGASNSAITFAGGLVVGAGTKTMTFFNPDNTSLRTNTIFAGVGKEITGSGQLALVNGNTNGVAAHVVFGAASSGTKVRSAVSIGSNMVVSVGTTNVFTTDSDLTVEAGGTFYVSPIGSTSLTPQEVRSLTGGGTVSIASSNSAAPIIFTINGGSSTATSTFSGGVLNGTNGGFIAVTKGGSNTQVFSGTNTYSGQTLVNAGALLINGSHIESTNGAGFGTTTGHFQVESGATLGGSGLIAAMSSTANASMVLVKSGGYLAPGGEVSPGTLRLDGQNITGSGTRVLNMASGAKFKFDLAGDGLSSDMVSFYNYAAGDLTLNSNQIDFTLSGALQEGNYTVSLFKFYSDSGTTLTNSGITNGLAIGTLDPGISGAAFVYNSGGNSIDLTYSVVPEPSTVTLLAAGFCAMLFVLRRRQMRTTKEALK